MGASRDPIVTSSFVKLRRVATGFEHLRGGRPIDPREERALRRVVRQLGATALRLLTGELESADEGRAGFAHALIAEARR